MNRRDLEQHLQDLFEGTLDPEGLAVLQHELKTNTEARETYVDYAELFNALQLRAEGIDLLQVVPMGKVGERRHRNILRISTMAAAAMILFVALVLALVLAHARKPSLRFTASPGSEVSVHHDLTRGEIPQGQVLEPGSTLVVSTGTVELKFASGIQGIIRGPAELTMQREDLIDMKQGTAWFDVPHGQEGFKVTTPGLVLIDLGTAFGIRSRPGFPHEVHVFAGKVEAHNRQGSKHQEILTAGQARVADPSGGWQEIPIRPEDFSTGLPTATPEPTFRLIENVSLGNELAYAQDVSASDLLHELKPITKGWKNFNGANVSELNDGIHGGTYAGAGSVEGAWTTVGATAEYDLGKGPAGKGYDISSIQSIASWNSAGFGNQTWSIEVMPVGGAWTTLGQADCKALNAQPLTGGGATKVVMIGKNGLLANGIESLRVTAGPVAGSVDNVFVWRELDVFGGPAGGDTNGR